MGGRDLEQLEKIEGFNGFVRGWVPVSLGSMITVSMFRKCWRRNGYAGDVIW